MAEWSDIASCYRWLHNQSNKIFHVKTLWINLPVIVLSTLGGTASFGIQSLFENDENAKKYASFGIGGISLLAGLLTTVGNYLRYAQLEESHRVAAIAWGKFQRLIAVELALNPIDRIDSLDFLKICRADLDRLIEACENGADVAIGSRYVKGGTTENWPLDRLIYSKGGSLYTRMITGMPVKDPTAGFICYKNKVLAAMQLDHISFIGYAFQIEMKFASWRLGFKLKEVPITFIDRKIGTSKMSKGIIKEAVLGVLSMQWESFTGRFIKQIKREQL